MVGKKIITLVTTFIFTLVLANISFSQNTAEQTQNVIKDTPAAEGNGQPAADKDTENKTGTEAEQAEAGKKAETEKREAESEKIKEEAGPVEEETEEIEPEESELDDNVWDTRDIEKREGWGGRQDRIQGGFGIEDMQRY